LADAQIRRTTWRFASFDSLQAREMTSSRATGGSDNRLVAAQLDASRQLSAAAARTPSDVKAPVELRWQRRFAAAEVNAQRNALREDSPAFSRLLAPADATTTQQYANWSYVIAGDLVAVDSTAAAILAEQFGAKSFGRFGDDEVFQAPSAQAQRFADQFVRDAEGAPRAVVVASPPKVTDRAALLLDLSAGEPRESSVSDGAEWTRLAPAKVPVSLPLTRWAIAMGIVALSIAFIRKGVRWRAAAWLSRQPHLTIAGVGMLWWLFLWPGWIGLVIAAIGIVSAWRLTWPLAKVASRPRPSSHA
jgi:hypothetical protein